MNALNGKAVTWRDWLFRERSGYIVEVVQRPLGIKAVVSEGKRLRVLFLRRLSCK